MANAIPVHRRQSPKPEEAPKQEAPQADIPEPVEGKDHPVLGKWHGHGWHRQN